MALPPLGAVKKPKCLIEDEAYDVYSLRGWLKGRHIKVVIPSKATEPCRIRSTTQPTAASM